MDKIINRLLKNTYTRSLSILVFVLVFVGVTYFTVANAQSYLLSNFLLVQGGVLIDGVSGGNGLVVIKGNVGIGTSDPIKKLEVVGDVEFRGGETSFNDVKFTSNVIEHKEVSLKYETYTYQTINEYVCACPGAAEETTFDTNSRGYAETQFNNFTHAFMSLAENFFFCYEIFKLKG